MSYELYRLSSLGKALEEVLRDFESEGLIPAELAQFVLKTFDRSMCRALNTRVRNKLTFKADQLLSYRFCDNVWTFVVKNAEITDPSRYIDFSVPRLKFVACDGRPTATQQPDMGDRI